MKRAIVLAAFALAGCQASNQTVDRGTFDPGKVAYFKDARTDICFAVSAYSRIDSKGVLSYGQSMTAVPCSPKVEQLANAQ